MKNNDQLFSLDIIGSSDDVTKNNCALKQNKTTMLGRGTRDYIISMRNEILFNRGYNLPESWDHEWTKILGPVWTPENLTNIESWILPEYFHPESSDETKCVWANNRIGLDGDATTLVTGGFEQNDLANMPVFLRNTSHRNFNGLKFDGTNDVMRGSSGAAWNVGTSNFLCYVAFLQTDSDEKQPVVAKNQKSRFLLEADWSGSNISATFNMANNELLVRMNTGSDGFQIIGFGRGTGPPESVTSKQWIRSYNFATETTALSADTSDLDHSQKPGIGDAVGVSFSDEFDGVIYEIIFVNDDLGAGSDINDDVKEKIEGYLAWKYNVQGNLYSGHTYENNPPRDIVAG